MKKCNLCEQSFEPVQKTQKYCSDKCKRQKKYKCSQCRKTIIRYKNNRKHVFCSSVCASLFNGRSAKVDCGVCDTEFIVKKSSRDRGFGKFCSKKCQNESQKISEVRVCPNCEGEFEVAPSDTSKYCTAKCSFEAMELGIPKDELYNYYIAERKTTREVAKIYNTSKTSIRRALKRYGIPIRSAAESRKHKGYQKPSKKELYKLYWEDWLSYEEIAYKFKVDASSVPVWLKGYDIESRENSETRLGKNFVEPSKEQLHKWYNEQQLTLVEIGEKLGCGEGAVSRRLKNAGIEVRSNLYGNAEYKTCTNGLKVRSNYERYFANLLIKNEIEFEYEPRLPFNKKLASDFLVNNIYIEIWGVEGSESYEKQRIRKTKLYKKHNLHLLEVYPNDFKSINNKINKLKRLIN